MKKLLIVLALLVTVSANAQWVKVLNGLSYNSPVYSLATSGNYVYAGSGFGVYYTTNDGSNWTRTNLNNAAGYSILINGTNIFAGTQFGVYKTTNNGTNWTQTALTTGIWTMAKNGDTLFAGSLALGVYRSTNNGLNWTQTSLNNKIISSLAIKGNMIFAGDNAQAIVYRSTDNGNNWTQFSLGGGPTRVVLSLAVMDNNIFAGTDNDGIFISTNNGLNWTQNSFNTTSVLSLLVNGNNIFAGGAGGAVYLSTNQGVSWISKMQGMGIQWIHSLTANSQYIFAGNDSCAWRRSLTEIVGVQKISTEIPEKYSLSQNYPNPFNPETNIEFTLPKTSFIKITVFDIAGKEVETLVNERLQSGTYKANWNASAYTSGVYFYKLVTDSYSETKKMVLIK